MAVLCRAPRVQAGTCVDHPDATHGAVRTGCTKATPSRSRSDRVAPASGCAGYPARVPRPSRSSTRRVVPQDPQRQSRAEGANRGSGTAPPPVCHQRSGTAHPKVDPIDPRAPSDAQTAALEALPRRESRPAVLEAMDAAFARSSPERGPHSRRDRYRARVPRPPWATGVQTRQARAKVSASRVPDPARVPRPPRQVRVPPHPPREPRGGAHGAARVPDPPGAQTVRDQPGRARAQGQGAARQVATRVDRRQAQPDGRAVPPRAPPAREGRAGGDQGQVGRAPRGRGARAAEAQARVPRGRQWGRRQRVAAGERGGRERVRRAPQALRRDRERVHDALSAELGDLKARVGAFKRALREASASRRMLEGAEVFELLKQHGLLAAGTQRSNQEDAGA